MVTDLTRQRQSFESALAELRAGEYARAASLCEEALRSFPDDASTMCLAAKAYLALRQFEPSERHAKEAIRRFPTFAAAHDAYGDLMLATGRADRAVTAYAKALRLDPARPATLAKIERATQVASAADGGAGDERKGPRTRMAFGEEIREAESLQQAGDVGKAEDIYRRILKKDPDHVEAARLLAGIASRNKRFREAEVFLLRTTLLAPNYGRAWVDLVEAQREQEKYDEAIKSAERLIAIEPDKAESHMVYAGVAGLAGLHEEAIASYRNALELAPQKAAAMCGMAHHLKTIGEQEEAIRQYRACIAAKPDHAEAYWSLANLKTFRFEEGEVLAMEALVREGKLTDESLCMLHNALGLEYEARRDFDRAFVNFHRCNSLRRKQESYDPVDTEATHDRVIQFFDEERLRQGASADVHPVPIFIVGLPRSGSTLIEQILASHSQVEGTHELSDLSKLVRSYRSGRNDQFPETLGRLKAEGWARLGQAYLERTRKHRSGRPFFIDKNPNNFVFTGLLKLAMPNAKVINARRHPVDSCLGSYKQLFASGQPFTYDLTELGEYYLQYQRLMDHWHRVLPGFVLDVHYEHVVADLETEVRRMLDFCGLPFEESCLKYHETRRAVKTASSEQVRRPIYSSSVEIWRNYEQHLGELLHILKPLFDQPSAAAHTGRGERL
ncbi:MAG TPA: sulfotransferase [Woeseiaceae bacterium]|nr:sulfotransferase [Woeseiaceae bacterium]